MENQVWWLYMEVLYSFDENWWIMHVFAASLLGWYQRFAYSWWICPSAYVCVFTLLLGAILSTLYRAISRMISLNSEEYLPGSLFMIQCTIGLSFSHQKLPLKESVVIVFSLISSGTACSCCCVLLFQLEQSVFLCTYSLLSATCIGKVAEYL